MKNSFNNLEFILWYGVTSENKYDYIPIFFFSFDEVWCTQLSRLLYGGH